jgi:hypothetical protein
LATTKDATIKSFVRPYKLEEISSIKKIHGPVKHGGSQRRDEDIPAYREIFIPKANTFTHPPYTLIGNARLLGLHLQGSCDGALRGFFGSTGGQSPPSLQGPM